MTKRKRDREKASRQQESEALKTKEKMGERESIISFKVSVVLKANELGRKERRRYKERTNRFPPAPSTHAQKAEASEIRASFGFCRQQPSRAERGGGTVKRKRKTDSVKGEAKRAHKRPINPPFQLLATGLGMTRAMWNNRVITVNANTPSAKRAGIVVVLYVTSASRV